MKNKLKEKIRKKENTLGIFQVLGDASITEIIGYAGYDYVLIDSEHGPFDVESAQHLIRAAKLAGTTPLVRVKDKARNSVLKMLDVGAMGLVIPNIHEVSEIKQLVKYGKYYPIGERGFGSTSGNTYLTADYTKQGIESLFQTHNDETLMIPQCETKESLDNIEEIAQVDGVDGIFIGPYDLSVSLGIPGRTEDALIIEAVKRVIKACEVAGKFTIIYTDNMESIQKNFDLGVNSVTYSSDASVLSEILSQVKEKTRK